MKTVIIKTVSLFMLISNITNVSLAAEKQQPQQQCQKNGKKYNLGQIITEDGRRYQCKENGQWQQIN